MDVASAELDQLCQGAVEIHTPSALSAGSRRRLKPFEGCGFARYNGLPGGGVPEWPKGTGCKPVGSAFRGSNPLSPTEALSRLGHGGPLTGPFRAFGHPLGPALIQKPCLKCPSSRVRPSC